MVFPFIIPALIGAAATIGGGMIAQGAQNKAERNWNRRADEASKEPQIITNTVDLKRLRQDAEEAGFNPLTVLRAGGLAGYNVQQHPNLHPLPNVNHGASPLGNAVSGLGSQIFGMGADMALAGVNAGYQRQLQAAAFAGMPSGTTLGGAPVSMSYDGPVRQSSGGAMSLGRNSYDQWSEEIPGITNPMAWDWWYSHPMAADIETGAEARYGDVGGAAFFPATLGMDIGYTLRRGVHNLTGWDPANIGEGIKSGIAHAWSSMMSGNPSGTTAPLSITVGGPNQTGGIVYGDPASGLPGSGSARTFADPFAGQ